MQNIIHITQSNELSISNNQLLILEDEREIKISLNDILAIIVENCHCRISAILQLRLAENNIPLIICNEKHQPTLHSIALYNHFHLTVRINEQINWNINKKKELWSKIIENKINNQRNLLKHLSKSELSVARLETYRKNVLENVDGSDQQEAIASRIYFQEIYGDKFKRFEDDGVNSALNYGYMVLRAIISSKIVAKGFHPSLGINHHSQFNSYNLSDDIIEVFRPIVDYVVYYNQEKEAKLSKELRQRCLLITCQKIYWTQKEYELPKVIDYYIDSIRNYFLDNEEIKMPELRIENYEY